MALLNIQLALDSQIHSTVNATQSAFAQSHIHILLCAWSLQVGMVICVGKKMSVQPYLPNLKTEHKNMTLLTNLIDRGKTLQLNNTDLKEQTHKTPVLLNAHGA